jgi:hypothetical protein
MVWFNWPEWFIRLFAGLDGRAAAGILLFAGMAAVALVPAATAFVRGERRYARMVFFSFSAPSILSLILLVWLLGLATEGAWLRGFAEFPEAEAELFTYGWPVAMAWACGWLVLMWVATASGTGKRPESQIELVARTPAAFPKHPGAPVGSWGTWLLRRRAERPPIYTRVIPWFVGRCPVCNSKNPYGAHQCVTCRREMR